MSDKKTKETYENGIYDSLLKSKMIADGLVADDTAYNALTTNQKIIALTIYKLDEKEKITEYINKLEKSK